MPELVLRFVAYNMVSRVAREVASDIAMIEEAAIGSNNRLVSALGSVGGAAMSLGTTMAIVGGAAVAAFGVAAMEGAKFESQLTLLHTHADVAADKIDEIREALLKLGPAVGYGPEELAKAFFKVESQITSLPEKLQTTTEALLIQTEAAKLAQVGHADLEKTTSALTSVMAAYSQSNLGAESAAAIMNRTIGEGKMRLEDFNSALATGILPVAQQAGISLSSMGASIATLTDLGVPATRAATYLRSAILQMMQPSGPATKALEAMGVGSVEAGVRMKGFSEVLDKAGLNQSQLTGKLRETGSWAQTMQFMLDKMAARGVTTTEALALIDKAFGGIRSGTGVVSMVDNIGGLVAKEKDANDATKKWNENWDYFQAHDPTFRFKQLVAEIKTFGVVVGEQLQPLLIGIFNYLDPLLQRATRWAKENGDAVRHLAVGAAVLLAVGGSLMAFQLTAMAIAAMITAIGTIGSFAGAVAGGVGRVIGGVGGVGGVGGAGGNGVGGIGGVARDMGPVAPTVARDLGRVVTPVVEDVIYAAAASAAAPAVVRALAEGRLLGLPPAIKGPESAFSRMAQSGERYPGGPTWIAGQARDITTRSLPGVPVGEVGMGARELIPIGETALAGAAGGGAAGEVGLAVIGGATAATAAVTLGWLALIVAAVVAVGVGLYELITHWDQVKKATMDAIQEVPGLLRGIGDAIKNAPKEWGAITQFFTDMPSNMGKGLADALTAIQTWTDDAGKKFQAWEIATSSDLDAWLHGRPSNIQTGLDSWGAAFVAWQVATNKSFNAWMTDLWTSFSTWITQRPPLMGKQLEKWGAEFVTWEDATNKAFNAWIKTVNWVDAIGDLFTGGAISFVRKFVDGFNAEWQRLHKQGSVPGGGSDQGPESSFSPIQDQLHGHAAGGFVGGAFGSPRMIIAHGGELILNPRQQQSFADMAAGGGGERQPIVIHTHLELDGKEIDRRTLTIIADAMASTGARI